MPYYLRHQPCLYLGLEAAPSGKGVRACRAATSAGNRPQRAQISAPNFACLNAGMPDIHIVKGLQRPWQSKKCKKGFGLRVKSSPEVFVFILL